MSETSPYIYSTYSLATLIVLGLLKRLHQSKCLVHQNGDVEVTLTSGSQKQSFRNIFRGSPQRSAYDERSADGGGKKSSAEEAVLTVV